MTLQNQLIIQVHLPSVYFMMWVRGVCVCVCEASVVIAMEKKSFSFFGVVKLIIIFDLPWLSCFKGGSIELVISVIFLIASNLRLFALESCCTSFLRLRHPLLPAPVVIIHFIWFGSCRSWFMHFPGWELTLCIW